LLITDINNSKNLAVPLGRIASAASKRSELEKCVLLQCDDEGLTLTAVDTHTHQLTLRVPESQTVDTGVALLTASSLKELVGTFETQTLSLALDEADNQLHVQSEGDYKLPLYTESADKFPIERELPPVVGLVEAERLAEALDAASDLCAEGEMVVLTAKGDVLSVYTRGKGVMFSRTSLQIQESVRDWAISIPVALIAHLPPKMTGTAELRLDDEDRIDRFAVANGREHLLIRQVSNDNYSHMVDAMLAQPAPDYYTLKTDGLVRDLKRASIFKDNAGLRLRVDGEYVVAEAKGPGGSMKTPHQLVDGGYGGAPNTVSVDPGLLGQAIKALSCANVVSEQVKTCVPAAFEGDEEQEGVTLRLYDVEAPDHRVIVLGTLAV
jgi:hypothetical protein